MAALAPDSLGPLNLHHLSRCMWILESWFSCLGLVPSVVKDEPFMFQGFIVGINGMVYENASLVPGTSQHCFCLG